jgi:hypothetical protein
VIECVLLTSLYQRSFEYLFCAVLFMPKPEE